MKLLNKMERRFGRYAIRNLSTVVIATYVIGYLIMFISPDSLNYLALSPYLIFRHGQVWRLITWVLIPPESPGLFTIIMLFFYYSLARTLERTWGDFLFNVYIIGGLVLTVIGACLMYPILMAVGTEAAMYELGAVPGACTTYYVNMSIFLAFAVTYPDMEVLLYFFIPVRIKWMGYLYGAFLIYDFIRADSWAARILMIVSLLNFVIYFLSTRNLKRLSPQEFRRRADFRKATGQGRAKSGMSGKDRRTEHGSYAGADGQTVRKPSGSFRKIDPAGARHRCAICGRTELTDPGLEFRFCSKCEGSFEYCQDHLFTHVHVKAGEKPQLTPEAKENQTRG